MPQFFLPDTFYYQAGDPLPEEITLSGKEAFHLSVSLRARVGDEAALSTRNGFTFFCKIKSISGGKQEPVVILSPFSVSEDRSESPCRITLFQGMPKGKKTDGIIQKCVELGVGKIVFVYLDRSVPRFSDDEKKILRSQKIVEEACKQCGRGRLVEIGIAPDLEASLSEMKESQVFFACYEEETEGSLKNVLKTPFSSASFLVGPEGGLSQREVQILKREGIPTVTLGKRILRTETASPAVLSMILYEKEL